MRELRATCSEWMWLRGCAVGGEHPSVLTCGVLVL